MDGLASLPAILVGLTFVIAAANKLRDPHGFALGVLDYEILPPRIALTFARSLPFAEVLVGITLLAGVWPLGSGLASAALLFSFLCAVLVKMGRGRSIACHCFGSLSGEAISWPTVVRLLSLLGCAGVVVSQGNATPLMRAEVAPVFLLAGGGLLLLYLVGAAPASWRALRTKSNPAPSHHGTRVSFRNLPLMPIAVVVRDRTHETSRCGGCP